MRTWTLSSFASFFPVNWWGMVYMGILFWVLNDEGIFVSCRGYIQQSILLRDSLNTAHYNRSYFWRCSTQTLLEFPKWDEFTSTYTSFRQLLATLLLYLNCETANGKLSVIVSLLITHCLEENERSFWCPLWLLLLFLTSNYSQYSVFGRFSHYVFFLRFKSYD